MLLHLNNDLRIDFRYQAVQEIVAETHPDPAFIISLCQAPGFYQKVPDDAVAQLKVQLNLQLGMATAPSKKRNGPSRIRLSGLHSDHSQIAGNCLVYRLELQKSVVINLHGDRENIGSRIERRSKSHEIPTTTLRRIDVIVPKSSFVTIFNAMMDEVKSFRYDFPFALKFQLHKLVQNNYLQPQKILQLLPDIQAMVQRNTEDVLICVTAVRKLFGQISWGGPDADAEEFDIDSIRNLLIANELQVLRDGIPGDMSPLRSNYDNVADIYHGQIMPSGMYLQGPEPESKNHVLRKYPDHHDYFARVQFCDEDGEPVFFSP